GMSIIARTAGIGRSAPELQWDLNYLLKLWNAIDGAAKGAKGAFLIYQESSLVIRAIRDYFNHDIGDILIDTDDIYEQAQQFMAHVMPEHAARVKRYRDDAALFSRFQIEHQIESAYARTVQLPSGGAIVIDHTEALVSIDVNSARAIKGGDIEETATRTNLEAADEVARQMRLRDLGGLIVIDFIDMDESKNRREVESRLRDALRQDRARVQFGSISKFGLMEMSRQRLKPALSEGSSIPCPRCGGSGHIRDTESSALQILRIIQEECLKDNTAAVHVQVPVDVASFLLNEKRPEIAKIELKQRVTVLMVPNKTLETPNYRLERLKHDDPRLDHIEASYKMAEEVEDPTSVTRRSQEPTNKQTPVIKGVLPDAPAPVAVPRTEAARATPAPTPAPAPVAPVAAAAAPAAAPQVPETGFLPWLKRLFGVTPAAVPTAAQAPARATAPADNVSSARADGRPAREGEARSGRGDGDQRRGGRGEGRGGRDGERRNGREGGRPGERREPREARSEQRAEGGVREAREVREPREIREPREPRESREMREPREPRPAREGERRGRGERRDGEARPIAAAQSSGLAVEQTANQLPPATEALNGERPPRARGERGGRTRRPSDAAPDADGNALSGTDVASESEERVRRDEPAPRAERTEPRRERRDESAQEPAASALRIEAEPAAPLEQEAQAAFPGGEPPRREGDERRPRSRDRYGRDRRERAPRDTGEAVSMASSAGEPDAPKPAIVASQEAFVLPEARTVVPSPAVAPAPVALPESTSDSAGVQRGELPKVETFELPLADLTRIAEGSGLQWVNSNAERIASVQATIAAEPPAVRVPRMRPPVVIAEEAPLMLVETKRDLSGVVLPFEKTVDKTASAP
ncbi:MAG: ribonuclease, Rne/Rng family, partial [Variovorax sp.]|nr:ribonuclease, Rne/Rng family [Variovorax sp.]